MASIEMTPYYDDSQKDALLSTDDQQRTGLQDEKRESEMTQIASDGISPTLTTTTKPGILSRTNQWTSKEGGTLNSR